MKRLKPEEKIEIGGRAWEVLVEAWPSGGCNPLQMSGCATGRSVNVVRRASVVSVPGQSRSAEMEKCGDSWEE